MMVAEANRTLGMLKRTFESRDSVLWKDKYICLVRPHLEYDVQAWNPHLKKNEYFWFFGTLQVTTSSNILKFKDFLYNFK